MWVCGRVRLSTDKFFKIKLFPDPMMKDDGHFKLFEEIHGTTLQQKTDLHSREVKKVLCLSMQVYNMPRTVK